MSNVDRCVCFDVPFTELHRYACEHGVGVEELRERFGCGRGCALCLPYIRVMLRTGQTSVPLSAPTADDLKPAPE